MTSLTRDYPYLYLGSLRNAREYNELPQWRESHQHNVACKEAIEEAIRNGFDGMHLDRDCAKGVIEDYGFKRVGWVLANTIQLKSDDGRFSLCNKEWAGRTFIPPSDRNHDFVVGSHPAVLDGFVTEFRDALAELQMFDYAHCDSLTGEELTGRVLVMNPSTLKESYWAPENQLWYATGGFGCTPTAAGRAVYATCLGDGEKTRWNRTDFIGIIKDEHLPDWAKEQVEKLQSGQEIGPVTPTPEQVMQL